MKNPYKAVKAIERLVEGDLGLDMERRVHDEKEKKCDPRLKLAAKIITDIYKISHAEDKCLCSHKDWEKIKYEILNQPEE